MILPGFGKPAGVQHSVTAQSGITRSIKIKITEMFLEAVTQLAISLLFFRIEA